MNMRSTCVSVIVFALLVMAQPSCSTLDRAPDPIDQAVADLIAR